MNVSFKARKNAVDCPSLLFEDSSVTTWTSSQRDLTLTLWVLAVRTHPDSSTEESFLTFDFILANEEVIFSFKCNVVVHPGLIGKKKLSPRILILTHQALYLIMIINQKGQIINKLDRRIELQNISGAMMSPFADNFISKSTIHYIRITIYSNFYLKFSLTNLKCGTLLLSSNSRLSCWVG